MASRFASPLFVSFFHFDSTFDLLLFSNWGHLSLSSEALTVLCPTASAYAHSLYSTKHSSYVCTHKRLEMTKRRTDLNQLYLDLRLAATTPVPRAIRDIDEKLNLLPLNFTVETTQTTRYIHRLSDILGP
jgi:hypothetical protein